MRTFYIMKYNRNGEVQPVVIDIIITNKIKEAKTKFRNVDFEKDYIYELLEQDNDKLLSIETYDYMKDIRRIY